MFDTSFYKHVTAALFGILIVPGMVGCAENDAMDATVAAPAALTQEQASLIATQCDPILDDLDAVSQDQVATQELLDLHDACVRQVSQGDTSMGSPNLHDHGPEAIAACETIFALFDPAEISLEEAQLVFEYYETCLVSYVPADMGQQDSGDMNQGDMQQGGGDAQQGDPCQGILDVLAEHDLSEEEAELVLEHYELCIGASSGQDDMNQSDMQQDMQQGMEQEHDEACDVIIEQLQYTQDQTEIELILSDYEACLATP